MSEPVPSPFAFWTRSTLTRLTGRRAHDLAELVAHLRTVPESVVFHHTHHFLVQHQHLSPEPPNDFAFWVTTVLQEEVIGERLAAVDTVRFGDLGALRDRLVAVIQEHLDASGTLRSAPPGQEFHFMDGFSVVLPTGHRATSLTELAAVLHVAANASIAYHLFESRLRLGRDDNDFSRWLDEQLGERELAERIRRLDPYTQTAEGVRQRLVALVTARIAEHGGGS